MTFDFTLTLGHIITLVTTLASVYFGALYALLKLLAAQQERRQAERFGRLDQTLLGVSSDLRKEADATRALETKFLQHQAELARDYVRRDDFIRAIGTVEARIDNFALRMERALQALGQLGQK